MELLQVAAFVLFVAALLLLQLPTKCQHECPDCARLAREKARRERDEAHAAFHRMYGPENCPYCKGDRK